MKIALEVNKMKRRLNAVELTFDKCMTETVRDYQCQRAAVPKQLPQNPRLCSLAGSLPSATWVVYSILL